MWVTDIVVIITTTVINGDSLPPPPPTWSGKSLVQAQDEIICNKSKENTQFLPLDADIVSPNSISH